MNSTRTAIFDLVDAMTSSEKAYFKKFAYKYHKNEPSLFYLFDCVERLLDIRLAQSNGIEEKVKERFLKKYPEKNYIKSKHLLFNLLLDNLRNFSKKKQDDEQYFEDIVKSNLLVDKNLFHSAHKLLQKSLEKSRIQELPYMELLILFKLNLLFIKNGELGQIKLNLHEQLYALKGVESKIKYAMKYDEVYQIFRIKGILKSSDKESHQILNRISQELASWDLTNVSGKTQFNHYMVNQLIAYVKGDNKNSLKFSERAYKIAKENFHLFIGREVFIYGLLSKLINDGMLMGDFSYYTQYINDLIQGEFANENIVIHNKIQYYLIETRACILKNEFEKIEEVAEKYNELDSFASLQNKISIKSYFINAWFAIGKFKKVNIQINELFEILKTEKNEEIELRLELLQLIGYLETKHFELLEYRIRSFENRIKNDHFQASYLDIIKNIKGLININNQVEENLFYNNMLKLFEKEDIDKDKTNFSFSCWALAKINNSNYRSVFKQMINEK